MRACFLGQNICALGYGVATLQSPPLIQDEQSGDSAPVRPGEPIRPLPVPPAPAQAVKSPAPL